jgi:hypothetical protein
MNNENQAPKTSRELEVGALWLKKSKAGADFLAGYFLNEKKEKVNIVVFKNSFKQPGELSPDYRAYLSEKVQNSTPQQQTQQAEAADSVNVSTEETSADEIPF